MTMKLRSPNTNVTGFRPTPVNEHDPELVVMLDGKLLVYECLRCGRQTTLDDRSQCWIYEGIE